MISRARFARLNELVTFLRRPINKSIQNSLIRLCLPAVSDTGMLPPAFTIASLAICNCGPQATDNYRKKKKKKKSLKGIFPFSFLWQLFFFPLLSYGARDSASMAQLTVGRIHQCVGGGFCQIANNIAYLLSTIACVTSTLRPHASHSGAQCDKRSHL